VETLWLMLTSVPGIVQRLLRVALRSLAASAFVHDALVCMWRRVFDDVLFI